VWEGPHHPNLQFVDGTSPSGKVFSIGEIPQHYLVRYEELVSDPGKVLKGLSGFLGCDFDVKMVEDYSEKAVSIVRDPTHP